MLQRLLQWCRYRVCTRCICAEVLNRYLDWRQGNHITHHQQTRRSETRRHWMVDRVMKKMPAEDNRNADNASAISNKKPEHLD